MLPTRLPELPKPSRTPGNSKKPIMLRLCFSRSKKDNNDLIRKYPFKWLSYVKRVSITIAIL